MSKHKTPDPEPENENKTEVTNCVGDFYKTYLPNHGCHGCHCHCHCNCVHVHHTYPYWQQPYTITNGPTTTWSSGTTNVSSADYL